MPTCSSTSALDKSEVFVTKSDTTFTLSVINSKPLLSSKWKMAAYTAAGNFIESTIDTTVCGNELISTKINPLKIEINKDEAPGIATYTLADMFANTLPECKIVGIATVTKAEIPKEGTDILLAEPASKIFTINEDNTTLSVNPTELISTTFYIVAYTLAEKFAAVEVQA